MNSVVALFRSLPLIFKASKLNCILSPIYKWVNWIQTGQNTKNVPYILRAKKLEFGYKYTYLKFFQFFFWERDTDRQTKHEQGRGRERERHRTQRRLQAPCCQHKGQLRVKLRVGDQDLSWSQRLNEMSHPGALGDLSIFNSIIQHHIADFLLASTTFSLCDFNKFA